MDKYPVRRVWCSEFVRSEVREVCKEQGPFAKEHLYHTLTLLSKGLSTLQPMPAKFMSLRRVNIPSSLRNISYTDISTHVHTCMSVGELLMLT